MGRCVPQSLSPKTTQVRKPGIRNTRSVEHMLEVFSVKVRITFRAGIGSDVGKVSDLKRVKQGQQFFTTPAAVSHRVKRIHEKSLSLASYIIK
jgi:hypothetical protein